MSSPQTLRMAICLVPFATSLDFIGPMDVLGLLVQQNIDSLNNAGFLTHKLDPAVRILPTYFSASKDPVIMSSGPPVHADKVYDEEDLGQYDVILVTGGPPVPLAPSMDKFLKEQAPGAQYIMSVCTGAFSLGQAGLLDGKKATTHKATYKLCVANSSKNINWVPKARWVVDGKVWTSSGVTAGIDMAYAFLIHLAGKEYAEFNRAFMEFGVRGEGDDEFAAIHGLV